MRLRALIPALAIAAAAAGEAPVDFPNMAPRIGEYIAEDYYDARRVKAALMVERALRALEQAEISLDTRWVRGPDEKNPRIELDIAGQVRSVPAPAKLADPDLKGAMELIEKVRIAVDAGDFPPERARELDFVLVNGALSTLDPHTFMFPPEPAKEFQEDIQGEFHGIGAYLRDEEGRVVIDRVMPGRPAERAGVADGDVILAIDGETTTGLSLDQAVRRIRGPKGTAVRLTLSRASLPAPVELPITRELVQVVSLRAWRQGPVGYIRMDEFNQLTGRDLLGAIEELRRSGPEAGGGAPIQALVLDLRFNGGGLLDQAKVISDFFLPRGLEIVRTVGADGDPTITRSSPRRFVEWPVVVLTGTGTASAAEILSGALQKNDRGLVAGSTTYGKGSVQTTRKLADGSQLKLTIQEYRLPGGDSIQDVGVAPDLLLRRRSAAADGRVDLVPYTARREADNESALANLRPYQHASALALSYLARHQPREVLKNTAISARDFHPDQEAMLVVDLLTQVCADPGFTAAAAEADAAGKTRQLLIERLRQPVARQAEAEAQALEAALAAAPRPVAWGQPGDGEPRLAVRYEGPAEVEAGASVTLPFTVENLGGPVGRLYALVSADRDSSLWEDEIAIGALAAGEKRTIQLPIQAPIRAVGGGERFTLELLRDGEAKPSATAPVAIAIRPRPRPHLSYRLTVEEPGGDGRLDPGETGTAVLAIRNDGEADSLPIALQVLKDNNPFLQLGGEVIAKLDPIPAGGQAERRIPLTLVRTHKGRAYDNAPVRLVLRAEEVVPEGQDPRNRAILAHTAAIPVAEPLNPVAVQPPRILVDGIEPDGTLRLRIRDDNLRFVALFQDEDKIDLRAAAALPESDGVRTYAPRIPLHPGLNTVRIVAADADDAHEGVSIRLWGPAAGARP
ncbi:MAG: hypothetical protein RLZZ127_973 [Planctomycetota bacterium]|jgi:carboxyl-terminal processing protease